MFRVKEWIVFDITIWALQPMYKFMNSPDKYAHTWSNACTPNGLVGGSGIPRLCHEFNQYDN